MAEWLHVHDNGRFVHLNLDHATCIQGESNGVSIHYPPDRLPVEHVAADAHGNTLYVRADGLEPWELPYRLTKLTQPESQLMVEFVTRAECMKVDGEDPNDG